MEHHERIEHDAQIKERYAYSCVDGLVSLQEYASGYYILEESDIVSTTCKEAICQEKREQQ